MMGKSPSQRTCAIPRKDRSREKARRMAYKPRRSRTRSTYSARRGRSSTRRSPRRSYGRRSRSRSSGQVIRIVLQTGQTPGEAAQQMAQDIVSARMGRAKH